MGGRPGPRRIRRLALRQRRFPQVGCGVGGNPREAYDPGSEILKTPRGPGPAIPRALPTPTSFPPSGRWLSLGIVACRPTELSGEKLINSKNNRMRVTGVTAVTAPASARARGHNPHVVENGDRRRRRAERMMANGASRSLTVARLIPVFSKWDTSNPDDSASGSAAMWLRLRRQTPGCPATGTRVWGGRPNKARVVSRCSGETCSQGSSGFREPLVQLAPLSR